MNGPTIEDYYSAIHKSVGELLPAGLSMQNVSVGDYPELDRIFRINITSLDEDDFWPTVFAEVEEALYDICIQDGLDTDDVNWDEVSTRLEVIS